MPTYSFACKVCEKSFDTMCSYSEYKSTKHTCPECGSRKVERDFGKVEVESFLRGEGWAGKLIKESAYRKKRSSEMDERMRSNHTTPKLTPNIGGEIVDTWEEAGKLAKSKGVVDTKVFEQKAHEVKKERNRPKGVSKKVF